MDRMKCNGALVFFSQLLWFLPWVMSQTAIKASTGGSIVPKSHSLWSHETFPIDPSESYHTTNEISEPRGRFSAELNKPIKGLSEYKIMDGQRGANESVSRVKRSSQGFIQRNLRNLPERNKNGSHFMPNNLKAGHAKHLPDKRYKLFNQEKPDRDEVTSPVQQTDHNSTISPTVKSEIQNHLNDTFEPPPQKTTSKSPLNPSTLREAEHNFASSSFSIVNASKESEASYKYPTLTKYMTRSPSKKSILQQHGPFQDIFGRMNSPPHDPSTQQLPWKKRSSSLELLPAGVTSIQQSSALTPNPSLPPSISSVLYPKTPDRNIETLSPLEVIDHHSLWTPTGDDKMLELLLKEWRNLEPHLSASNSNIAPEAQSNSLRNALNSAPQSELSSPNSDLLFLDTSDILPMSSTLSGLFEKGGPVPQNPAPQDVNSVISPQILSNMLLRLQVPSVGELANAVPVTRITPELVDAISTFIENISDAITQFLTDLQQIFEDNPLLVSLLAIALVALLWHLFTKGKKKKGHGYGHHHQQGYHRSWEPQFRKLDDYGQRLTLEVLTHLEGFGEWLNTMGNINEGL